MVSVSLTGKTDANDFGLLDRFTLRDKAAVEWIDLPNLHRSFVLMSANEPVSRWGDGEMSGCLSARVMVCEGEFSGCLIDKKMR